jgi:hypothetical protein
MIGLGESPVLAVSYLLVAGVLYACKYATVTAAAPVHEEHPVHSAETAPAPAE